MSPTTNDEPIISAPSKPVSAAQLAANRQNAQRSTGPKTDEGKQRCRVNAMRHGLTGQFHAMSHEDQAAFDIFCASLMADFHPETFREETLAVAIAEGTWRLSRGRALENNIFAIGMSGEIGAATSGDSPEVHAAICQARVWLADSAKLALLTLYESRIRRNTERDRLELAQVQAARTASHDKALEQAKLLARFALMNHQPYDPAPDFPSENEAGCQTYPGEGHPYSKPLVNGSVFSTAQIYAIIDFEQRLEEAAFYSNNGWDPKKRYEFSGVYVPRAPQSN